MFLFCCSNHFSLFTSFVIQHSAPAFPPLRGITSPLRFRFSPFEGELGGCSSAVVHLSFRAKRRISFCYFWLDPKVTQRSRLRALHTPSRRSQVGKSGNSLRFGQPDFLSPCSLLRRLTARGPWTNAEMNGLWLIVNGYFLNT